MTTGLYITYIKKKGGHKMKLHIRGDRSNLIFKFFKRLKKMNFFSKFILVSGWDGYKTTIEFEK